jgi:hypothetical protein
VTKDEAWLQYMRDPSTEHLRAAVETSIAEAVAEARAAGILEAAQWLQEEEGDVAKTMVDALLVKKW